MKSIEVSGKTVEQAIEIGLFKLEANREDVKIVVLDKGSLFDKAKVRLILNSEYDSLSPIEKFVTDFADSLQLKIFATVEETDKQIKVNFSGEDIGYIIGKRGDVLDAIQTLFSQIINNTFLKDNPKKILIDSESYRAKREASLQVLAHRLADKAVKTNRIERLEPMSSYERKIIHLSLEGRTDVTTESKDNEPNRYITIIPTVSNKSTQELVESNNRANND